MADLYTKKPYTAFESEAMVEQLFSDIQEDSYKAEDKIKHYTKKVERLMLRVNRYKQQLEDLLKYKNMDANIPLFSQVSGDLIYPDGKTEDGGTYITSDDLRKNWSNPSINALREVANRDPVSDKVLRNLEDLIKKDTNTLSRLTKQLEILRNVNANVISAIADNGQTYGEYKTRLSDMQKLYKNLANYRSMLARIPANLTSEASKDGFLESLADNCTAYVDLRNYLINLVTSFITDKYLEDKDFLKNLMNLLSYLMSTPSQYTSCYASPTKYLNLATGQLSEVQELIKMAKDMLDTLAKDKLNVELVTMKNSITSILRSSVHNSTVESLNQKQRVSINKEKIDEKNKKVKKFVGVFERIGVAIRRGDQNLDELFNEQPRDLLRKAALTAGFPVAPSKDDKEALRDNRREYVRAKYGGDIPFCDEVIVEGENGVKTFVKRSEAIEVSDGVYKKESNVTKETFLKNTGIESDIY